MYYRMTEINFLTMLKNSLLFHNYGNMEIYITLPQNTLLMRH